MDGIIYILFGTLFTAAIWYFFCGVEEEDRQNDKNDHTGCIVCLVLGFISTLIMMALSFLGK